MYQDVQHHVQTCHQCQIRSTKKVDVPLAIRVPSTIFTRIYVDIMFMPKAQGYRYIVAARDDLTQAAEGRALKRADAASLRKFFWQEIILERGHFIIREAILKSCNGNINQWPEKVHHAFFADKVLTRESTGFSPFYMMHGVDPVLPFDLTEATYMIEGWKTGMSRTELLALRIRQLEKRPEDLQRAATRVKNTRLRSKQRWEELYEHRFLKDPPKDGDLVLLRNTAIEKSHNRKAKPRYLGPFQVIGKSKGGSYVIRELDGTFIRRGVAPFRILPYRARMQEYVPAAELREDPFERDDVMDTGSDEFEAEQFHEEDESDGEG
ncbi:hypothetical protein PUNSTDRAFT_78445 [Punctularia strigosozonata HHB-11173 SS5]|uniref:Integrase zinc-binding domain-containing protein n=1 Tax=Punctularia strigosozonata (strain HHB-11173) TaxID=741275 RepID=R7S0G7_PUNST|nr:uncharacterized protein PUNSTDRAFT_78445 [Punctularia strigosozonata HHB-11173 SS5]EIN03287.1 hypothetical protein PUNSTDRAFT_78445 [Punctularia strigosozonata HHB-11173 SS5]